MSDTPANEYWLGTNDQEVQRLHLQHTVWKPFATDAWKRAGFTIGQILLDLGCGPGFATLDLAAIVGSEGKIFAIDQSKGFLEFLISTCNARALRNVVANEVNLNAGSIPAKNVDGVWARWIFAFVRDPHRLLREVAGAMKPGASIVIHEYFQYSTWRFIPPLAELEEFVRTVIRVWKEGGGDPDVGLQLPGWLTDLNFEILS